MSISKNGDLIIVKIAKDCINMFDIFDINMLEEMFKDIFTVVRDKYDITGLCNVDVYTNDSYGMIIEIDNVYYYEDEIDVKIVFHLDSCFLCEVSEDYILEDKKKFFYYYDKKYYTEFDYKYDSPVIYKESLDIVRRGIKIG